MPLGNNSKRIGYVRVVNYRTDMAPDSQPEEGEIVIPVDRRNPILGNRHILRNKLDPVERDAVIAAFEKDLANDFAIRGPMFQEIVKLSMRVTAGERIALQCCCKPSRCHGDSIVEKINQIVQNSLQKINTESQPYPSYIQASGASVEALLTTGLVVAGTGHRPDKLGGFSSQVEGRLEALASAALARFKPDVVISGMALGWDWALAEASLKAGIPLIAAIPFVGQERRWQQESQRRYAEILAKAVVVIVSPGGYSHKAMQVRNEWMVDRCHRLLALWDGSSGGTANCINYAVTVNRPYHNLWVSWDKYR